MSQVQFQIAKFKFRQYQNTTFFRHFAKFNAHQIFPLYGSLQNEKLLVVHIRHTVVLNYGLTIHVHTEYVRQIIYNTYYMKNSLLWGSLRLA